MLKLTATIDVVPMVGRLADISLAVREKATVRAINKVADQVKVQAAREIRDAGYNLKIARIKRSIAIRRASASQLVAAVKASGRPIGLIDYGAKETKRGGVSVQVKNGRKTLKDAFIATMPNGHRGVFFRKGSGHKKMMTRGKPSWHGLPIEELFGPSIPTAFMNQVVQDALVAAARDKFPAIFQHEVDYLRLKS